MGDCRIRIAIDTSLLHDVVGSSVGTNADIHLQEAESSLFASDLTIADCFAAIQLKTTSHPPTGATGEAAPTVASILPRVSVWDCTTFPTKNITPLCQEKGRITTLFAAGWFPSGNLQLLRPEAAHSVAATAASYHDTQFNTAESLPSSGPVHVKGVSTGALPSQVLQSGVVMEDCAVAPTDQARQLRQENKRKQRERETERGKRMDRRIQQLHAKANKNGTSAQVRNMLIKSRASGRSSLRQEDRIYFHCVWNNGEDDDDNTKDTDNECYRFFSLQDSVGRAVDHLRSERNNHKLSMLELLVYHKAVKAYRRLPTTLIFQDAVRAGYLTGQVDTIVLRTYDATSDATTDITEEGEDDTVILEEEDSKATSSSSQDHHVAEEKCGQHCQSEASSSIVRQQEDAERHADLLQCLQRVKVKAKSPAAHKVRQMKMKNKAKGDAKRVGSDITKRFFVELIVIKNGEATSEGYYYAAHHDPVDRFLRDNSFVDPKNTAVQWSLFSFDGNRVIRIATSEDGAKITWETAEKDQLVRPFDQVVLQTHGT